MPPLGLSPAATPAARKPAGRPPSGSSRTHSGTSTQREEKNALTAGRPSRRTPNIRFRFWTACDEAPFHRLSIAAKTKTLPVRSSTRAWMRQKFVSRTSRTPGGRSVSSTKGSSP